MAPRLPCEYCRVPEKTIDDCYHQTVERLTTQGKIKEISARLLRLATNHERVLYVYNILKELSLLPTVRKNPKDDKVSMYYRCQGNDYFKQKKYYEAWQSYNLSLLYAVTKSENYIYAVSNRSAVLFGLEKYEECIEDIKFVFSREFPEKLKNKLLDRQTQCLSKLAQQESDNKKKGDSDNKIEEILTLKCATDKKYVRASSKLKVVYTQEMGRHVIATEDIGVGEVLAEEDPYLSVLLQPEFLFCCGYCLSRKSNLYPCMTCTYTLYCSVACHETARKKYHTVECGLLPSLLGMEFSKMDLLALRAVLRSRTDEDSWLKTLKIAKQAESSISTDTWGCVKEGDEWVYDSKYYTPIHTLASNVEKRSLSDIFRKSMCAAVLTHLLSEQNFLKSDEAISSRITNYVSGTLLLHIMTSPTNMHSISTTIKNAEGKYADEYNVGSGAYAFLSLLNHSCTPNVVRYTKLGMARMSLIAIRPIRKGMQILDNYGYHHAVQSRESRQSSLKFQYKFTCMCEACVDDWPLLMNLKEATGLPPAILLKKDKCLAPAVIAKLMVADKETALEVYQPLCELVKALEPYAPCKDLAECQETLKQCLAIFNGVVPYDYSNILQWKAFPPCVALGESPHLPGKAS